jgi:S-ribosylhomocysteine lyase
MRICNSEPGDIEHTIIVPPYIRFVETRSDVNIYDLRLSQPNISYVASDVLHSLEHCLNVALTEIMGKTFIGTAPLGCSTGNWVFVSSKVSFREFEMYLKSAIYNILEMTEVPLCNKHQCGNYRNHNLAGVHDIMLHLLNNNEKTSAILHFLED